MKNKILYYVLQTCDNYWNTAMYKRSYQNLYHKQPILQFKPLNEPLKQFLPKFNLKYTVYMQRKLSKKHLWHMLSCNKP